MGQRALRLFISLAGVATMTLVGYRLLSLNATTQGFAYLLLVLVIASAWGFFEACVASIASTLTFNFFFGLSRCSLRERLIFRLATIEGMRPGEILGLQFGDLRSQSVRVSRRVYRGDVDSPKTGRSREVALSPATRSLLSEWVTLLADQQPEAWVFQSENPSSPLMRDNVQRRFIQPKLANIGLGWVTFQVMRRTNASLGHKRGIDPKVAADQRGHGLGVSMDVYTQSDLDQKLEAVRALDSAVIQ